MAKHHYPLSVSHSPRLPASVEIDEAWEYSEEADHVESLLRPLFPGQPLFAVAQDEQIEVYLGHMYKNRLIAIYTAPWI